MWLPSLKVTRGSGVGVGFGVAKGDGDGAFEGDAEGSADAVGCDRTGELLYELAGAVTGVFEG